MTTFNFVFPIWLDFISYFFCVEFGSWVSILSFYKFLFLFWLGCIQYVFCAEFVSWFLLWPSAIFLTSLAILTDWISISFFLFCDPILILSPYFDPAGLGAQWSMAPNLHNSVLSEGFETNKKLGKNHNLNTVRSSKHCIGCWWIFYWGFSCRFL